MKYSSAISLAMAPVALGKMARSNRHPAAKRDPSLGLGVGGVGAVGVAAVPVAVAPIVQVAPIVGVSSPLLLLYTNAGGGAQNQIINSQVTVTQTVQVPPGGVATAIPDANGVTQTIQPGSSAVMAMVGATHTVTVGGDLGRAFFPADIAANVGDTLLFNFMAQNHSVTQASFDNPCQPLPGGMDSGFMPNPDNSMDPVPQVAMQLTTTDPLWMYCAQGDHCSVGMVLSINPTVDQTHAQFQANAIATGNNPATGITGGAPADVAADPNAVAPIDPAVQDPNLVTAPSALPDLEVIDDPLNAPTAANSPPATGSVATGALAGGVFMGLGTVNPDGSCNCMVQCNSDSVAAAAVPAEVGASGFGGQLAVIPMDVAAAGNAGGLGAQSVEANTIQPLDAASVDAATVDPLAAATIDPLAAATAPADAGSTAAAAGGLVAPAPEIVG